MAFALILPSVSAAPWLQYGYDAARTGATPDAGPATNDVAFRLRLGDARSIFSSPLLLEGAVIVLSENGTLARVDLNTTLVGTVASLGSGAHALAAFEDVLYVALPDAFVALRLDGSIVWEAPYPPARDVRDVIACVPPAIRRDLLAVACGASMGLPANGASGNTIVVRDAFLMALDPGSGELRWVYHDGSADRHPGNLEPAETVLASPPVWLYPPVLLDQLVVFIVEDPALAGGRVEPSDLTRATLRGGTFEDHFRALDAATGEIRWDLDYSRLSSVDANELDSNQPAAQTVLPTGEGGIGFFRLDTLAAVDLATGERIWDFPLAVSRTDDVQPSGSGGGFALAGGDLFVASGSVLQRIDPDARSAVWRFDLPGGSWNDGPLAWANGTLYGIGDGSFHAIDAQTGLKRWSFAATGFHAVGADVVVIHNDDGDLIVVGSTPAGIGLVATVEPPYPGPGETVVVDLSESRPGLQSPQTEYRADWGDGRQTDWGSEATFSHSYDASGDRTIIIYGRNSAGQTSTLPLVVHVGGAPPVELNAVQQAFSSENQERTFFVLGLLITFLLALLAAARTRRRRTLLARELAAMGDVFARTKDKPATCEAALANARARAHDLLVRGKLDEAQSAVLSRHADELAARLRLGLIEERFGYLTVALARRLRGILDDGRVTPYERAQFLDAIAREPALNGEQRAEVRRLVEEWSTRDAGG